MARAASLWQWRIVALHRDQAKCVEIENQAWTTRHAGKAESCMAKQHHQDKLLHKLLADRNAPC
jgi:hypothetical protein